jgi:NodT family efflux transporter outer membrane factor (OMF) lipoprotein
MRNLYSSLSSGLMPSLLIVASAVLCGCTVGPKYHPPAAIAPTATTYPAATASNAAGIAEDGTTWQPAAPSDAMLRGNWWEVFGDKELNGLEEQLNVNNQNIKQSFQQFMEARALIREARGQLFPTVSVGPAFNRSKSSGNLKNATSVSSSTGTGTTGTTTTTGPTVVTNSGSLSTLWSAPLDISWEPDLWGRIRNTIHEDQYSAQVSAADLANEQLTEQAALAQAFFELRGEDALQAVLNGIVAADRDSLKITQGLYETGVDNQISVVEAQATLQAAEAQAIAVAAPRGQYEHAIAMLIGKPATDFHMPVRGLDAVPPNVPIGVPSQLIERRPDVAAAERTMAAANAQIGVESTAFFPTITLSATGGFESSTFQHWFDWPSRFWSVGPSISQPIYQAGLHDYLHQYVATYNADVAAYQQTVLTAFQQVEDYLTDTRIYSQQVAKQREASATAQIYVNLALDRYKTGLDPYLDVITAQNTLLADQQTLYTTQISQMTAAVQLVQALGGGWNKADLPTPKQVEAKAPKALTTKVQ